MTAELLREISHPMRLEILRTISVKPESLERIAQLASASIDETSVHLERLRGSGLVDKETGETFRASPLGQLTLTLLPGLDFVAANSDFFRDHELTLLPPSFLSRLGELNESTRMEGAVSNIQHAERMFSDARSRIWVVANEVMLDAVPVVREKITAGADFRFVIDQSFKPPTSFEPQRPDLWRRIPKIPAATVATDKEAILIFLDRKLEADYSDAFVSKDPVFVTWCVDLVDQLWKQGHPIK